MVTILFALILIAGIAIPGFWVKRVLHKYSEPHDRYRDRGSGAELARHLLDRFDLQHVAVEIAPTGDHYDPEARAVRLVEDRYHGHSLTAITVAAHEVGHAIQDARSERLFRNRQHLAKLAVRGQQIGSLVMLAAPVVMLVSRSPGLGLGFLAIAVGSMLVGTLVHLITLPVELDASFGKALPILQDGGYLHDGDLPHANRILKAAAMTYVAASLASLLNVGRWLAVLRR
jgi:Zn-dependent membrane protease YugP